jgi:APA family basic amino acid/polyamine antiporter
MAAGTGLVIVLYLLVNVSYLVTLPLSAIQHAPDDRVATAALQTIFGGAGAGIMAIAIVISTFGCANGMILAGARVYWAMAHDRLFFRTTGTLNRKHVPAVGLALQCVWASLLILPRTRLRDAAGNPLVDPATSLERYGNVYSNLLDYVVFAVLIFYVLTIVSLFVLRRTRPEVPRPYRALGYPVLPALYVVAATVIALTLLVYKTQTTWPGLAIVLTGIPVYFLWGRFGSSSATEGS